MVTTLLVLESPFHALLSQPSRIVSTELPLDVPHSLLNRVPISLLLAELPQDPQGDRAHGCSEKRQRG